jgi:hypothetical protein
MANWQRTLRLKDVWTRSDDDPIQDLARTVAERLRALTPFGDHDLDEERLDIAAAFEDLANDENTDEDDFDRVMSWLYDWADISLDGNWNGRKVCWVETI